MKKILPTCRWIVALLTVAYLSLSFWAEWRVETGTATLPSPTPATFVKDGEFKNYTAGLLTALVSGDTLDKMRARLGKPVAATVAYEPRYRRDGGWTNHVVRHAILDGEIAYVVERPLNVHPLPTSGSSPIQVLARMTRDAQADFDLDASGLMTYRLVPEQGYGLTVAVMLVLGTLAFSVLFLGNGLGLLTYGIVSYFRDSEK